MATGTFDISGIMGTFLCRKDIVYVPFFGLTYILGIDMTLRTRN